MKNIEQEVYSIIKEYTDKLNLEIYDIIYAKQGQDMYLSIYIDKPEGIDIDDCENLTRLINDPLDEKLNIKDSYFLEVSSPGLERVLRTDEHYIKYINSEIAVTVYKAIDKIKNFIGILKEVNELTILLEVENETKEIERKNIAQAKTVYDFDNIKGGEN